MNALKSIFKVFLITAVFLGSIFTIGTIFGVKKQEKKLNRKSN